MTKRITRRNILRSTSVGASLTVALPFLDCFLNSSGTALAATGASLPFCYGTWWQGLGLTPGRWVPDKIGKGYENKVELKMFDRYKDRINIISGTKYFLDGRPLETHTTGWQIASQGGIPTGVNSGPSMDSIIADTIGARTRFRSLEISLDGSRASYSKRAGSASNPSEPSPLGLYTRIFGTGFKDPNAAEFTPDPAVQLRRSVLSYVTDERKSMMDQVGAADRARLDEYFTGLRQIEQQLDIELQKPAPLQACAVPGQMAETKVGKEVSEVTQSNKLLAKLLAQALACGQTRVFNIVLGANGLRQPGSQQNWHMLTHEEPVDDKLGFQKETTWFIEWANTAFVDFIRELDGVKEGDGAVLDRVVMLWQTDHGYARTHTMDALPILTVGNAGGRLKTGLHVAATGDPATRVGLTVQQALGVSVKNWGQLSNETSKTVTELLA
jgi:hypothetical protein